MEKFINAECLFVFINCSAWSTVFPPKHTKAVNKDARKQFKPLHSDKLPRCYLICNKQSTLLLCKKISIYSA